jgi:hypothetical protein
MKKIAVAILFTSSLSVLSGCTTEQVYSSLQDAQRDRCEKMMEPDRSQCLRNNASDYETFKKERR